MVEHIAANEEDESSIDGKGRTQSSRWPCRDNVDKQFGNWTTFLKSTRGSRSR